MVKPEDFEPFLEDFCDFLDALEAAVAKMKAQIAKLTGAVESKETRVWTWNPEGIVWSDAVGFSGAYQRHPDVGKPVEATEDYKRLLEDLKAHGGKLQREGWFYWLFRDGATIGRKRIS